MASRKKPAKTSKEELPANSAVLVLIPAEVQHLRDLMSIILPSDDGLSVSMALARATGSENVEEDLWEKVVSACVKVGLPHGEGVQDYAVVAVQQPPLGVFPIGPEEDDDGSPQY